MTVRSEELHTQSLASLSCQSNPADALRTTLDQMSEMDESEKR